MATIDPSTANARLQADPAYQQALAVYRRAVANAPKPRTIAGQRNDDAGAGGGGVSPEVQAAQRRLGQVASTIVQRYGLPGQPQAWVLKPETGELTYEEDHSGRNILLMMGGIVAGGLTDQAIRGGGTAAATTLGSSTLGPSTAGNMAATQAVVAGSTVPPGIAAPAAVAPIVRSGLTSDIVRSSLPMAGDLINSYLQSRSQRDASEEMLKYYREALAYEKEKDAYDRKVAAEKVAAESGRYGDYLGRINPYLETGVSANDRMASLLGLPARSGAMAMPSGGGSVSLPANPKLSGSPPAGMAMPQLPSRPLPGMNTTQPMPHEAPVLIQAPTGEQREVPANQVQHFLDQGATVVQRTA